MIRAVVDTNVIFSGLMYADSVPGRILEACLDEDSFRLVMSPLILAEVEDVLLRPRLGRFHGLSEGEVSTFLARLARVSTLVEGIIPVDAIVEDPSDNKFLSAAVEAKADYVVSGDRHLLEVGEYEGVPIISPREFFDLLSQAG